MAMVDRGSFMWFLISITQIWLSIKLMEDVSGAITALFGAGAAAAFVLGVVLFRQEQRDLLLNPLRQNKEVHTDQIEKQSRGVWIGVIIWLATILFGSIFLP
jgi:hypothetical protein